MRLKSVLTPSGGSTCSDVCSFQLECLLCAATEHALTVADIMLLNFFCYFLFYVRKGFALYTSTCLLYMSSAPQVQRGESDPPELEL